MTECTHDVTLAKLLGRHEVGAATHQDPVLSFLSPGCAALPEWPGHGSLIWLDARSSLVKTWPRRNLCVDETASPNIRRLLLAILNIPKDAKMLAEPIRLALFVGVLSTRRSETQRDAARCSTQ